MPGELVLKICQSFNLGGILPLLVTTAGSILVRWMTVINCVVVECRPAMQYTIDCNSVARLAFHLYPKSRFYASFFVGDFRGERTHGIDLYVVIDGMFVMLLAY